MRGPALHRERPRSDVVRHPFRWVLYPGRPGARWLIRRRYDVRVHHAERCPRRGPVIVAANHVGYVDGPLLAIFAPRPVHALTKNEMFGGPMGLFLHGVGQIPIDRLGVDPRAVRISLKVLREGGVIGIFPEGTRGNGELDRFARGAAYLAMVTGAAVVPLTFLGSREPGGASGSLPAKGARIDVVIGQPVRFAKVPWPRNKAAVTARSLELREQMLTGIRAAQEETGRRLPGHLPVGDIGEEFEPLPGNVVERSA